jgi:hypothetical protein
MSGTWEYRLGQFASREGAFVLRWIKTQAFVLGF